MRLKVKLKRFLVKKILISRNTHLSKLNNEQKYVYSIAKKLISFNDSTIEFSPNTEIFYIKNGLKLIKFDRASIHLVNGKYSYLFSFPPFLMDELIRIFNRQKQIRIKHLVEEISKETTFNLKNILTELNDKG